MSPLSLLKKLVNHALEHEALQPVCPAVFYGVPGKVMGPYAILSLEPAQPSFFHMHPMQKQRVGAHINMYQLPLRVDTLHMAEESIIKTFHGAQLSCEGLFVHMEVMHTKCMFKMREACISAGLSLYVQA